MSLLKIIELSKRFGGLQAVSNVSFEVEKGEIVGLIGPNGAGKSTTMHLIIGVHKPTSGKIIFDGQRIERLPIHKRMKAGISVMFQHSRPLDRQTVIENIELSLIPDKLRIFYPAKIREIATEMAKVVGIDDLVNKHPHSLPYGAVRKMELAKALALRPKLLLLDEPFAGLSHSEVEEFTSIIKNIKEKNKELSIIIVDHNVKAVYNMVNRMVAIYAGKVITIGKPEDVVSNETVKKVFLGEDSGDVNFHEKIDIGNEKGKELLKINIKSLKYGKAEALRNIELKVREGQFVSIVGLNGAGKTSLFKAIFSFVPYEGDIIWNGKSIKDLKTHEIVKSGISFVPETRELFKYMTVEENLELSCPDLTKNEIKSRLEEVYSLFPRLGERKNQLVFTLSGGEQQMLNIGRALMQKPKMIVFDEPTLGLAPVILESISKALDYLHKQEGLTILLGEQNLYFALKHSDVVYLLEHGSLMCNCSVGEFMEKIGEKYLA